MVKQIIIGLIYLAIAGAVTFGIYRAIVPVPTCDDGIQNQDEQGVDCGPVCGVLCAPTIQPLQLPLTQAVPVRAGEYDVIVQVRNPNDIYGSGRVPYTLTVEPTDASAPITTSGTFYIMPGQTRFLAYPAIRVSGNVPTVKFQIGEPEWQQIDQPLDVMLPIRRESYQVGVSPDYEAVVQNDSNFDFQEIDIAVVALDTADTVLAVNRTAIMTVLAHEERYFKVSWPSPLPAATTTIRVEATTNLFANDNFLKTHGVHQPFQELQ